MKSLALIALSFFCASVHAQIDTVTLTGTAEPLPFPPYSSIPFIGPEPFLLTFTLNTNSGTQSYEYCGTTLCAFDAQNLTVLSEFAEINGLAVPLGTGASAAGSGPPSTIFSQLVLGTINNFNWEFDAPTRGLTYLDSIIEQRATLAHPDNGQSSLDGYALDMETISITHPLSVPEPGSLALMVVGLLTLAFASRVLRCGYGSCISDIRQRLERR